MPLVKSGGDVSEHHLQFSGEKSEGAFWMSNWAPDWLQFEKRYFLPKYIIVLLNEFQVFFGSSGAQCLCNNLIDANLATTMFCFEKGLYVLFPIPGNPLQ